MNDQSQFREFFSKNHLFFGLPANGLDELELALEIFDLQADEILFREGDANNALFFILSGSVHLFSTIGGVKTKNNNFKSGNFFGEAGLFTKRAHTFSAVTNEPSLIARLDRRAFFRLIQRFPHLRENFLRLRSANQMAAEHEPNWLFDHERVYAFERKTNVLLALTSIFPTLILISSIILAAAYFVIKANWMIPTAVFGIFVAIVWFIWNVIDWSNDHYIVTNARVIWIERILFFYDSRSEANMENILAVSSETSFFERLFGVGTVLIKTYTGQIKLRWVDDPKYFSAIIEDHLFKSKQNKRALDKSRMRKALYQRLGYETSQTKPERAPENWAESKKSGWFEDLFKTRTETGNTITYHKHLFGLVRDSFKYMIGFFTIIFFLGYWELFSGRMMPMFGFVSLLLLLFFLTIALIYQYLDWRNDIYQITADQIIDIDRKPLGDDDRKAASIENILSTRYQRDGILGLLFNFGTVYIMIGNNEFNFEDVSDPSAVQQDIIQRQIGLKRKKEEMQAEMDNERMSEWINLYHQTTKHKPESKNQG